MSEKAQMGNWDEDFKNDSSDGGNSNSSTRKPIFMDLSKPGNYRIRLVGGHIKCRKHFKPYKAIVQDNEKDLDPAWQAGWFPNRRFAINVIDKTGLKEGEVGTLKILEKGPQVFKAFANYKAIRGIDPAGQDGPDFNITVEIPKKDDKMSTEYTVMPLEKAPLTAAEKKMISDCGGLFKLTEIYRSTPAEKMKEMWDNLPESQKIPPSKKGQKEKNSSIKDTKSDNKPIEEKMENSPAEKNDKDLFDEDEKENIEEIEEIEVEENEENINIEENQSGELF